MKDPTVDNIRAIGRLLADPKRALKERFRALFSLKNINKPEAIECISAVFGDDSALLKHELAYCLGQMANPAALPILFQVLNDTNQEPIVRHEAAEAIGAIGQANTEEILAKFVNDESREVSETCKMALERLSWLRSGAKEATNKYRSIDPAPPADAANSTIDQLVTILLDESRPMFERYRYMFALRDLGSESSALALTKGLKTSSALFSHEIAFVLGQMQDKATIPALVDCLSDCSQHEMVRHECAEALGAIATDECYKVLERYLNDEKRVVRESCEIALDMCDYETSSEFQYAITEP